MRRAAFGLLLGIVGCGDGNGQDVGIFHVTGALEESCAEQGLLASPPAIESRAWMRRVGEQALHWDDGTGRIIGSYDQKERGFVLARSIVAELVEGCTVGRHQLIEGTLDAEPEVATAFEGSLTYAYELQDETACFELPEEEAAVVAAVPCQVSYTLAAERE